MLPLSLLPFGVGQRVRVTLGCYSDTGTIYRATTIAIGYYVAMDSDVPFALRVEIRGQRARRLVLAYPEDMQEVAE